ncbi:MAG TPA: 4-hydroxy-tetrahydrodipicolinate reductase [Bacteroidia bacterium]
MKIGLLGYGKMGKTIEAIAIERGHSIAWKISKSNRGDLSPELLKEADVVIEFTRPEFAVENINFCIDNKVPVVVGTTGWYSEFEEIKSRTLHNKAALFYATNFSVGVNLFWKLNKQLAQLMNANPQYKAKIEEVHHIHKLDEPSGTGITTAEGIIENHEAYAKWKLNDASETNLPIYSYREGEVPGTHRVIWTSEEDKIMLEHEAFGRKGFASGAVLAAEWLNGKEGVFTMTDMLA